MIYNDSLTLVKASSVTHEDFFKGVYEHQPVKTLILFLCLGLTIINILLLYSIIWYEHFGSDLKRTLINKFAVSICWCGIESEIVLQGLTMIRYTLGPFPSSVCIIRTILLYSATMNVLLFIDLNLLTRYFFIFFLKNPAALKDDFWYL
jgi:hypothetical protein